MSEATKKSLRTAEERLALAETAIAESRAKRDEAKAALDSIEQRRRSLARSLFMGNGGDQKTTRAAANARDDAQKLVEDMNLVVDEAENFLVEARAVVFRLRFQDHWEDVMELGRQRAAALESVIAARDALYARAAEFKEIGVRIIAPSGRAALMFPQGAMGVNPTLMARFIYGDNDKLAAIITDAMPHDIFRRIPEERSLARNHADIERSFWNSQEIDREVFEFGESGASGRIEA